MSRTGMHLSRRQSKEQGIAIRPVTAPEVKQPLLLQAVVQALRNAGQHVQCQSAPSLLAEEDQCQPYAPNHCSGKAMAGCISVYMRTVLAPGAAACMDCVCTQAGLAEKPSCITPFCSNSCSLSYMSARQAVMTSWWSCGIVVWLCS